MALTLHDAQIWISLISPKSLAIWKNWYMTLNLDLATYNLYFKHFPVWYILDWTWTKLFLWCTVLCSNLIGAQQMKRFSTFCGTLGFITMITRTHNRGMSWGTSYFQTIYLNIFLPSLPRCFVWYLCFTFPDQNVQCIPVTRPCCCPTMREKVLYNLTYLTVQSHLLCSVYSSVTCTLWANKVNRGKTLRSNGLARNNGGNRCFLWGLFWWWRHTTEESETVFSLWSVPGLYSSDVDSHDGTVPVTS
jgi:hypothetical protein